MVSTRGAEELECASNEARRAWALHELVLAVVLGAMHPLSKREVLREVDLRLRDAWTDVTGLEAEAALDALDDERVDIDLNGRYHGSVMPSSIDESLPHWVVAARALEALAETEGSDCETLRNRQVSALFKHPLLEAHEEKVLAARGGSDPTARNELVEHNLRLVRATAGRWDRSTTTALDEDDLFQEACLGLIRAAEKYDPRRGFRFSTYATPWLRQALSRAVDNHSRTIRVPVHIAERVRAVGHARRKLLNAHPESQPIQEELSAAAGISAAQLEEIERVRAITCFPISDMTPNDELRVALMEADPIEDEVLARTSSAMVDRALSALSPREAEVLRRRLGLDGNESCTLDAIGQEFDLTRERIRQLETRALKTVAANLGIAPPEGVA